MILTQPPTSSPCVETCGNWPDEPSSCAEFDDRLEKCGYFRVYREVSGYYVQPRLGADEQTPRIDRLLVPKQMLLNLGWRYGIIGVECKASKKKLGKIVSQCLDYSRAIYTLEDTHVSVACSWIFIWPLDMPGGDIASVMDQNKIGGVCGWKAPELYFKTASVNMLNIPANREVSIGRVLSGRKTGSR